MSKRDELAIKERIYEPKYGGKDHSGYDTMMKYEINYEREEAFCNGWNACCADFLEAWDKQTGKTQISVSVRMKILAMKEALGKL